MTEFDKSICQAQRTWLRWTQAELAERAEVGLSTLADFERGARETEPHILQKLRAAMAPHLRFRIEHDGFVGDVIGSYVRRDGKKGVVMQQVGTNIVHVYGEKWLVPD